MLIVIYRPSGSSPSLSYCRRNDAVGLSPIFARSKLTYHTTQTDATPLSTSSSTASASASTTETYPASKNLPRRSSTLFSSYPPQPSSFHSQTRPTTL